MRPGPLLAVSLLAGPIACARSEGPRPVPGELASTTPPAPSPSPLPLDVAPTPEAAWARLLSAMTAGDMVAVARLTTAAGLASLDARRGTSPRADAFPGWAKAWSKWEVRWKTRDADRATARLGPEIKEHGLELVRVDGGWKLDRWMPGE